MIPFGTEKNIGKSYCLSTLTGWTAWPVYTVIVVLSIERSGLYDKCFLKCYILSWNFV